MNKNNSVIEIDSLKEVTKVSGSKSGKKTQNKGTKTKTEKKAKSEKTQVKEVTQIVDLANDPDYELFEDHIISSLQCCSETIRLTYGYEKERTYHEIKALYKLIGKCAEQVIKLAERYIIYYDNGIQYVLDTWSDHKTGVKISEFLKNTPIPSFTIEDPETGKTKRVTASSLWINSCFAMKYKGGTIFFPYAEEEPRSEPYFWDKTDLKIPYQTSNFSYPERYNLYQPKWKSPEWIEYPSDEEKKTGEEYKRAFKCLIDFFAQNIKNATPELTELYRAETVRFLAHLRRNPRQKPSKFLMFITSVGTGKGTLKRVMESVWSEKYVFGGSFDKFCKFNASLETTLLVILDERNITKAEYQTLKEWTGDKTSLIERKGVDAYSCQTYNRFLVFTNHYDVLDVTDRNDRRAIEIVLDDSAVPSEDLQKSLELLNKGAEADDPVLARYIYDYLKSIDLDDYDPFNIPKPIRDFQHENEIDRDPLKLAIADLIESEIEIPQETFTPQKMKEIKGQEYPQSIKFLVSWLYDYLKVTGDEHNLIIGDLLTSGKDYSYNTAKSRKRVKLRDVFFTAERYNNRCVKCYRLKTKDELREQLNRI